MGYPKGVTEEKILKWAVDIAEKRVARQGVIEGTEDAKLLVRSWLGCEEREHFGVLLLDNQHRIIHKEVLFSGTIDEASVYPREAVKLVLARNAAAVILAHNHPSGMAVPSSADKAITRKLQDALNTVDVRMLDHLLVGGTNVLSFAEEGLL